MFFAFLRAINVGGRNVPMAQLRSLFEEMGFAQVETYIASGNVVFEADSDDAQTLQTQIEVALRAALGYEVATFLRTPSQLQSLVRHKPFDDEAMATAVALNVALLAEPLSDENLHSLMSLRTDIDDFHVHGRDVYWLCWKKQSESTFSNALFERRLKVKTTFRGMATLQKLAAKYA